MTCDLWNIEKMQSIEKKIDSELPEGLREHIHRVVEMALQLAHLHGADLDKVRLAALAHDLVRATGEEDLLSLATEFGISMNSIEKALPILLHGPVAAEMLYRDFGIDDEEVLEAVRYHTTAKVEMGVVAKVVFLADKLEPLKRDEGPFKKKLLMIAEEDLDRALLEYLDHEIVAFVKRGYLLHPLSMEARNELLIKYSK